MSRSLIHKIQDNEDLRLASAPLDYRYSAYLDDIDLDVVVGSADGVLVRLTGSQHYFHASGACNTGSVPPFSLLAMKLPIHWLHCTVADHCKSQQQHHHLHLTRRRRFCSHGGCGGGVPVEEAERTEHRDRGQVTPRFYAVHFAAILGRGARYAVRRRASWLDLWTRKLVKSAAGCTNHKTNTHDSIESISDTAII